ncbi:cytidine deaminase [Chitinophaga silvatica]|uniref:Cytidine deaminase n=1 Tax=Chitinophaga silvatica TaxID=2282649 RepID=A0A3E1YEP5_9BACT|nr:cytidine deaminase [Chitinophaga silvatica]RFS25006.1 cytidine deaminase [Chitinophaga silvatica]
MEKQQLQINFNSYDSIHELDDDDAWLLQEARAVTAQAYAPYSKFQVSAVIRLANGEIIAGTNQENASFPVGICAERVALSTATSLYPDIQIETIAISYHNLNGDSSTPISPCGICRQTLSEYEKRQDAPIRLIMGGLQGKVLIMDRSGDLLPLGFSADNMNR